MELESAARAGLGSSQVTPPGQAHVPTFSNFEHIRIFFELFLTRVRSNRKTDPGFVVGSQKWIQNDMQHAYIGQFFFKIDDRSIENRYIDRSVSIFQEIMPASFSGPKN